MGNASRSIPRRARRAATDLVVTYECVVAPEEVRRDCEARVARELARLLQSRLADAA